jgi:hypothetical protein
LRRFGRSCSEVLDERRGMMKESVVVIDERFNGPPGWANGGYACGRLADHLGGVAEVTLRRPVPLATPLDVAPSDDGGRALTHGTQLVAEAFPTSVDLAVPEPVALGDAESATKAYPGFTLESMFPCFVCGPQRLEGDGFRVFPSPVPGRDVVAAPWIPDAAIADADGNISPEFVWAVLDCTGTWATMVYLGLQLPPLGRQATRIISVPRGGESCVAVGWPIKREGRKAHGAAAVFSESGDLLALSRVTCIEPRRQ